MIVFYIQERPGLAPRQTPDSRPEHSVAMAASSSARPARKQISLPSGPSRSSSASAEPINLWTGKPLAGKRKQFGEQAAAPIAAQHRCCVSTDAGTTHANFSSSSSSSFICLHFARGECARGADCTYLHRVPCADDERQRPVTEDIFGRDRHATERQDMGGVGSFNRDNRTLYVAGFQRTTALQTDAQLEAALRAEFEEWGAVRSVRLQALRLVAFVEYEMRVSAEFAKEAMHQQCLCGSNQVLNVRWSTEDPNPQARQRARTQREDAATEAIVARMKRDLQQQQQQHQQQQLHDESLLERQGSSATVYERHPESVQGSIPCAVECTAPAQSSFHGNTSLPAPHVAVPSSSALYQLAARFAQSASGGSTSGHVPAPAKSTPGSGGSSSLGDLLGCYDSDDD
jgi:hypothetical protein